MGDDSSDDEHVPANRSGNLGPDPGSNEFVKVTGPEEHVDEMKAKQPDDISFAPVISSASELENGEKHDAEATSPKPCEQGLFSDEATFHADSEPREVGDDNNMPRVPGSFNMIGTPSARGEGDEGHSTWVEMFKRLRIK